MDEDGAEHAAPTLSIAIEPPITLRGAQYDALELREPRVSEIKASEEAIGAMATPANVLEAEIRLAAMVSGWPDEAIRELPASVLNRAASFLASFEERGRGRAESGPVLVIELDAPVEVQKGAFHEMSLREPKVSERKRAEQYLSKGITAATSRAAEISLVTDVSEWPPAAVLKMPISAFAEAADYLAGFLGLGRPTGERSRQT